MIIKTKSVYKHYKGQLYYYLHEAEHSETGEKLVIYSDGVKTWARPYSMFFGYVDFEGEKVRRFKLISQSSNK